MDGIHPDLPPGRFPAGKEQGIAVVEAAGTRRGDDENVRKMGDGFCLVSVFDIGITQWTAAGKDTLH
jgi:hypothetical protein